MANRRQQFRLGFLDGIEDRQRRTFRNVETMRRVKNADYMAGYDRGVKEPASTSKTTEKGNRK